QDDSALLEPYTYLASHPGKDVRTLLIHAFDQWLHVPPQRLARLTRIVSMLHTASLMIDDIEDDSQLRRGVPVVHKIYGVPQTINSANYVYFLAYEELSALRREIPDAPQTPSPSASNEAARQPPERLIEEKDLDNIVTAELLALHRGQGRELLWRDTLQCPTEAEYVSMVNDKTGGLFRIAIKLMMACATTNVDVDYIPLVNLIGIFFQIRDD
ncbi:hypothetical protein PLICRDRAFT_73386, partial [Plicaturopsis crispa FD-325 SS-3]